MTKEKRQLEDVVELTRTMIHEYFSGNIKPYFERLTANSIYVAGGMTIRGKDAILKHLNGIEGSADIFSDEYSLVPLGKETALVLAEVTTGAPDDPRRSEIQFTFVFRLIGPTTRLVYQHNSYNFSANTASLRSASVGGPYYAFIHSLLFDRPKDKKKRILFHGCGEDISADPSAIIYLCGIDKHVEVVCIGRIFTTDTTLKELIAVLPDEFYRIHRSYIVNTTYIAAIRRCEVELFTGEKLPIPAASFTNIRQALIEILDR